MIELAALLGLVAASALVSGEATAHVQDYQIIRLLAFQSDCQVEHLADRSQAFGPLHYFATCRNTTFYPDGVEVACGDRNDERTCTVLTSPRHFDDLDLLRR